MYPSAVLFIAIPHGSVMFALLAAAIPDGNSVVKAHEKIPLAYGFVLPSMVRELSNFPSLFEQRSENLDVLFFAGADL